MRGHQFGVQGQHRVYGQGVLSGNGGDGAGAVHFEGAEGAQVGLEAGATAGVRPGDGESGNGLH